MGDDHAVTERYATTPPERRQRLAAIAERLVETGRVLTLADLLDHLVVTGDSPQLGHLSAPNPDSAPAAEAGLSDEASGVLEEIAGAFLAEPPEFKPGDGVFLAADLERGGPGVGIKKGQINGNLHTVAARFLAGDGSGWEYELSGEPAIHGEVFAEAELLPEEPPEGNPSWFRRWRKENPPPRSS